MWIDDAGVAHTVSLPDPTRVMSAEFRVSLDALAATEREDVLSVVVSAEQRAYEQDWSRLRGSEIHVRAPAPADLLRGKVVSPSDVLEAIEQVVPRWQLDAIMALDDYLGD